jgi:hypothetical protein
MPELIGLLVIPVALAGRPGMVRTRKFQLSGKGHLVWIDDSRTTTAFGQAML